MNLAMGAQGFRPLPLAAARVVAENPDGHQAQPLLSGGVAKVVAKVVAARLGHSYNINATCSRQR